MVPFKSHTFGMRHIHFSFFQEQCFNCITSFNMGLKVHYPALKSFTSKTLFFKRIQRKARIISATESKYIWKCVRRTERLMGMAMEFRTFCFQITLSLCTLWVIIESCYSKLSDIRSLAWVQILMDEVQILKKTIIWLGLLLAVAAVRTACAEKSLATLRWRSPFKRGERHPKWVIK